MAQGRCVPDVAVVVNPPDGHTYDIQTSNDAGLVWFTVDTADNLADATTSYNAYVVSGYWQILKDGSIIVKTNLSVDERAKEGVQPGELRDVWNLEAWNGVAWDWLKDFDSLADAKLGLRAVRAHTAATISEKQDLRITDKNGKVVYTDKGVVAKPPAGTSTSLGFIGTAIGLIAVVAAATAAYFILKEEVEE